MRLFACAACRSAWDWMADDRARAAVEASERFADDHASVHALNSTRAAIPASLRGDNDRRLDLGWLAAAPQARIQDGAARIIAILSDRLIGQRLGCTLWSRPYQTREQLAAWRAARPEAYRTFCGLMRDVFLHPFRQDPFRAGRRPPIIASLARAAYEERLLPSGHLDLARLAVLSDALEEAGCTDTAILSHLRSPGPDVRGCWALDHVLGEA
ncbi:MAG: hypothetical protein K2W96_22915 [Gemmataceae bacterium]|nr:hypothetical protein [Gemmataceae bacterium]